jgi:hypothetical protein
MGFGLTISKMIVQQLKGTITAHSVVNQGSTFTFEITAKAQRRRDYSAAIEEQEELESMPSQEDCKVDIIKVNQSYNGSTLVKDSNRQQ